jgi:hypothetical protein
LIDHVERRVDDELVEVVFLGWWEGEYRVIPSSMSKRDSSHHCKIVRAAYLARATQLDLEYWNVAFGYHAQIQHGKGADVTIAMQFWFPRTVWFARSDIHSDLKTPSRSSSKTQAKTTMSGLQLPTSPSASSAVLMSHLSDNHKAQMTTYLKFARSKREENLTEIMVHKICCTNISRLVPHQSQTRLNIITLSAQSSLTHTGRISRCQGPAAAGRHVLSGRCAPPH